MMLIETLTIEGKRLLSSLRGRGTIGEEAPGRQGRARADHTLSTPEVDSAAILVAKDHGPERPDMQSGRDDATREVRRAEQFLALAQQDLDYAGDEMDPASVRGWLSQANDLLERARVPLLKGYFAQASAYARAALELGTVAELTMAQLLGIDPCALQKLQAQEGGDEPWQQTGSLQPLDRETVKRELARTCGAVER